MDMYVSDLTRMVVVGKVFDEMVRVLNAVKEAQQVAIDAILTECPNVDCLERKAREVLSCYGYEQFFTHSLGHGIGLEIHEPPRVGIGDGTEVKSGLVFTIEPGVYIPGKFGVRIEDDILVSEGRAVVLSSLPKIYEI
jgi:Xaa-Pro aminopeptidase